MPSMVKRQQPRVDCPEVPALLDVSREEIELQLMRRKFLKLYMIVAVINLPAK